MSTRTDRAGPGRRWLAPAVAGVLATALAVMLVLQRTALDPAEQDGAEGAGAEAGAEVETESERSDAGGDVRAEAQRFLDDYVEESGRVVRTDEGGDTVSEGQAYAMLIALGVDDRAAFERVWEWTERELLRPEDGLLSWRWADGALVDRSSATDADLDAARALVLAGERFDEPGWHAAGVALGEAILDHATAPTPDGLVLVAGQWATQSPYSFNASYVSPAATAVLAEAAPDPRWEQLDRGSRAALTRLVGDDLLPADWAGATADGDVYPVDGPAGQEVQFGYDGARVLVRHAEACTDDDRAIAASLLPLLGDGRPAAVYDLGGGALREHGSPLMSVAKASAHAATGDLDAAGDEVADAGAQAAETPTYYGDAWAVLGRLMLSEPRLGGCPPLEER